MIELPRQTLYDIARGKSSGFVRGRMAFIKHLSYSDQIEFDLKRETFFEEARKDGAPTNDERIKQMREEGIWDDAKENAITMSRRMIDGLREGLKQAKHPSMVQSYNRQIKEEEDKLAALVTEKYRLMETTAEAYADKQVNDFYICTNIYADEALTRPLLPPGEADYLTDGDAGGVVTDYNRIIDVCNDAAIKRLAIQPFFQRCFSLVGEQLGQFFGKPISTLTFYQIDLLRYGVHFRNIFQSNDVSTFPKNVLEDPDLLTDYVNTLRRGKEDLQQQGGFEEGSIVLGGKKEDNKALGVKQGPNLTEMMVKKGGQLGLDDLIKMAR